MPDLPSLSYSPSRFLSRVSRRGTEEEGTWVLVKQLNGLSREKEWGKKARGKEGIQ